MSEFSQPDVTIADKRALRHKLRLIGEVGGNSWIRFRCEESCIPPRTQDRFPSLSDLYLPGANVSIAIIEPNQQNLGSWAIAFDKFTARLSSPLVVGWRIGYALLGVATPEELTLQVGSHGTLFESATTEEPLEVTMSRGSLALDNHTNFVSYDHVPLPLGAAEVYTLNEGFAVLALAQCREILWE